MEGDQETVGFNLVVRRPCFGLPTACPSCLPVYIYFKLAQVPFELAFNSTYPDSDQIPYFESSTKVVYNNENGGVIERLKEDSIINLDTRFESLPEFISLKALIVSWLEEALMYELWIGSEGISMWQMYYSDLPWMIGKVLFHKQMFMVKTLLGINKGNAEEREKLIYKKASEAYAALSTRLGEQKFLFEDSPTSLDACFLAHVLFTVQALPETSLLRRKLLEHSNLVKYGENLKQEYLENASSSPSSFASSYSKKNSKPKNKAKNERTEEEKKFKKRARFFLTAQFIAVVLYLSVMGAVSPNELEFDEDDD